jgi:hypothetical protein
MGAPGSIKLGTRPTASTSISLPPRIGIGTVPRPFWGVRTPSLRRPKCAVKALLDQCGRGSRTETECTLIPIAPARMRRSSSIGGFDGFAGFKRTPGTFARGHDHPLKFQNVRRQVLLVSEGLGNPRFRSHLGRCKRRLWSKQIVRRLPPRLESFCPTFIPAVACDLTARFAS